jgi:ACDE family multidrug resistance protein
MVIGAGLLGISLAITGFTESLGFLMATISLQGLGSGLCLPAINNLVTGSADTLQRGIITGFYGTVRFFGAALGPPAFGLIQENPTTFFVIGGVVTVGVAALAYFFVTPNQNQGGPQGKEIRLVQPTPPKKAPMKPGPLKREPV